MLDLLEGNGAIGTIDAMGCQKAIAKKIVERGGDYILTVKDIKVLLLEDIQQTLSDAFDAGFGHDSYETQERGHGRQE